MRLGVFSVIFQDLPFEAMLEKVRGVGLDCVEIGTGAYPGNHHCDLETLVGDSRRAEEYRRKIDSAGLTVSALSCQGNPLHPNEAIAKAYHATFENTVLLAEKLGVTVINLISGCPGDSPHAKYPNWCNFAWPPDYRELLAWQWNEIAIPYWKRAAAHAKAHGISRLAIEMHPGFLVHNPETALKLRDAVGETIGVNFDPSHLFWLGIDIPTAIRKLGAAIFHVHAKDCAIHRSNTAENGCFDGKPYEEVARRSWTFRTVGWGHGLETWRDIASALREVGYDYALSIEHEDPLMQPEEGLRDAITFLNQVLIREPSGKLYWA